LPYKEIDAMSSSAVEVKSFHCKAKALFENVARKYGDDY